MDPDFLVKAGTFEGPLDLLLTLIEKKKMHISDVSLAAITDDYIAYINKEGAGTLADTADFIVIAATLMLIKSVALLPGLTITSEEQASIEELQERLRVLEQVRRLSAEVLERFQKTRMFGRLPSTPIITDLFAPPKTGLSKETLLAAMRRIISLIPTKAKLKEARVRTIIRLEDVISNLMDRVTRSIRMSFKEFASGDKMNIIVSFLAVLELVKQGSLAATQDEAFLDIRLENNIPSVPRYD